MRPPRSARSHLVGFLTPPKEVDPAHAGIVVCTRNAQGRFFIVTYVPVAALLVLSSLSVWCPCWSAWSAVLPSARAESTVAVGRHGTPGDAAPHPRGARGEARRPWAVPGRWHTSSTGVRPVHGQLPLVRLRLPAGRRHRTQTVVIRPPSPRQQHVCRPRSRCRRPRAPPERRPVGDLRRTRRIRQPHTTHTESTLGHRLSRTDRESDLRRRLGGAAGRVPVGWAAEC